MIVLPSMGPLHLTQPRYNAVSVLRQVASLRPERVFLASYSPEGMERGVWRDQNDLALFLFVPWATDAGVGIRAIGEDSEALQSEAEHFLEYLNSMPRGERYKERLHEADRAIVEYLTVPRMPEDYASSGFIEGLRQRQAVITDMAGEGPATGFRERRMDDAASRLLAEADEDAVVIVDILDYPALLSRLGDVRGPAALEPDEAERARAVMDRAWRLQEDDEWGGLVEQLMEIPDAEAAFLVAQIYLAAGQLSDATAVMEGVARDDFSRPEYLPGYVLARLGQLYDLSGRREEALRAYRGVLALSWAPEETREIAAAGMRSPFRSGPAG